MKKKIILIALTFTLSIIASLMFNFQSSLNKKSNTITLKNAEALARGEGQGLMICSSCNPVIAEALARGEGQGHIANGPGDSKYCAACMTYHTYCKAKNQSRCIHTGH